MKNIIVSNNIAILHNEKEIHSPPSQEKTFLNAFPTISLVA
jgi:hypothetical protein